jgi:hypothetical protein
MKFWNTAWFHRIATVVVTAGAWAASTLIPATAVIALGPLSIPVAGLVAGAIAAAGAVGIAQNPTIAKVLAYIPAPKRDEP